MNLLFFVFIQWMFLQLNSSWDGPIKQLLVDADTWLCKRRSGVYAYWISDLFSKMTVELCTSAPCWSGSYLNIKRTQHCTATISTIKYQVLEQEFQYVIYIYFWVWDQFLYSLTVWLLQSWERMSRFCARIKARLLPPSSDTSAYSTSSTTWPRPASSRGITSFRLVRSFLTPSP